MRELTTKNDVNIYLNWLGIKTIMKEIIIVKTSNSQELKKFLEQKHINYEIYQELTE
jgi:hypothetical protein